MKTAFLFPGQGAGVVGMGKEIAESFPAAAEIFKKADDIVGFDLSKICFEGPAGQLNSTTISQPAIFVTSAAILEVLGTNPATSELKPDVTAGLSLGEYTALYAAGVISFEDGLVLVAERGHAMQSAADATEGAMVSIIGLDEGQVNQLCVEASEGVQHQLGVSGSTEQFGPELTAEGLTVGVPSPIGAGLAAVNFNCPGQIVVSGSKAACQRAEKLAVKYGAVKAMRLEVAGAFHTEMMSPAADTLKEALSNCKISEPGNIKIIANINAEYYETSEKIAEGLIKQLTCPVLWQKCMEKLLADGVEKFYEVGPGRVLTGLVRRISRKTKVVNISSLQAIKDII